MKSDLLIKYLETGYSQLKETAGFPPWLLPGLPAVFRELGEEGLLEMAEPVGLSQRIKSVLVKAPEVDQVSNSQWKAGISGWEGFDQVRPVILALLRATEKVEALQRRDRLLLDPARIARCLATIACAGFIPEGGKIMNRLAALLRGKASEPAGLINHYLQALEKNDWETLAGVEQVILQDPAWSPWSHQFVNQVQSFPFTPKIIGIRPPASGELTQVLATMLKEVLNADDSRNHPGGESQNRPPSAQ